jgi:N-methylhydantoinase B
MTTTENASTLDPITYEILRHRLWSINDEAATTIARVSGSPVANESYDFNAALMTADGSVTVIGNYVMAHAAALDCIVQWVTREYSENPGIGPGDMFMTNDPYVGAMHQPDVAVIAPIFDGDRLIAWCGSIVHQSDVGGPVAGSVTAGARSIYEEAIPLAPVKIVEGGRIRKDIEKEYLIRSRTADLNALDLRGQVASNNVQTERILALCERYGTDVVLAAMDRLIGATTSQVGRRLSELPDGQWHHRSLIEHDGLEDAVYAIDLVMTKTGDHIDMDWTGSSDQAPAMINCSVGSMRGYTLAAFLTTLAYDIPWVPAGFWPHLSVKVRPGSIVDAKWPAGVSMGNTASGHNIRTAVSTCLSMMLDASEGYRHRAVASCIGSFSGQNISGTWAEDGQRFGTMLIDSMAGGGGAFGNADGIDTSGMSNAPAAATANVEKNEYLYPMLYLWRRETPDSGGPGEFRGGAGAEHAYVIHGSSGDFACTLFAHGVEQATSAGIAGGEPGSPNGFVVHRGGRDVRARFRDELAGTLEVPPPKANMTLHPDDVFVHWYAGGGGYGDPFARDVGRVLADARDGKVTAERAATHYGVVIEETDGGLVVDAEATAARRGAARKEPVASVADGTLRCRRCGTALGTIIDEATCDESLVIDEWPVTALQDGAKRFVLRRYHCPSCANQVHTEVDIAGAALIAPVVLAAIDPTTPTSEEHT